MGQSEIIEFLKNERRFTDKFFTAKEISEAMLRRGYSHRVYEELAKLMVYNLIEWKGEGVWEHKKLFRYKKHIHR